MRAHTTPIVIALLAAGQRPSAGPGIARRRQRAVRVSRVRERALDARRTEDSWTRPREEQQTIELYRVLCLVATGKEAEAKGVMEGLVARNPMFRPTTDLPPARALDLQRDAQAAAAVGCAVRIPGSQGRLRLQGLRRGGTRLCSGPRRCSPIRTWKRRRASHRSSDIRTLASGFHELSAKAATPPEPVAPVASAGVRRSSAGDCTRSAHRARRRSTPRATERRATDRVESADSSVPGSDPRAADRRDRGADRRQGRSRVGVDDRLHQIRSTTGWRWRGEVVAVPACARRWCAGQVRQTHPGQSRPGGNNACHHICKLPNRTEIVSF